MWRNLDEHQFVLGILEMGIRDKGWRRVLPLTTQMVLPSIEEQKNDFLKFIYAPEAIIKYDPPGALGGKPLRATAIN